MSNPPIPEELLKRAYDLQSEEETRALYRDWATSYDQTMVQGLGYLTPRKTAALLHEVATDKTQPVLDVGSGTGLAGDCLAQLGFSNLDALDYSTEMLQVAASRVHLKKPVYRRTIVANLNNPIDIADEAYGAMICTGTFTHAHVGADCLDELFRILKKGGCFACTVHKDVWNEAGFSEKVRHLAAAGTMRTKGMTMGDYFATDQEPQGWYIVWEKLS